LLHFVLLACAHVRVNAFGSIYEGCTYKSIVCVDGQFAHAAGCDAKCENCEYGSYTSDIQANECIQSRGSDFASYYFHCSDDMDVPSITTFTDDECSASDTTNSFDEFGIATCELDLDCEEECEEAEEARQWYCEDDVVRLKTGCEAFNGQCTDCSGETDVEGFAEYNGFLYHGDNCIDGHSPIYSYSYSYSDDFVSASVECVDSTPQYTTFDLPGCLGDKIAWGNLACDFNCDDSSRRNLGSKSQSVSSPFTKVEFQADIQL